MGEIAKAQSQAMQEQAQAPTFKDFLEHSKNQIEAVMPKHMSIERLYQIAMAAYKQTPHLSECSVSSVLSCVMKCAALGLEPSAVDGLGRAYIIPYRNGKTNSYEATFIMGYRGMIDLARRSGDLISIEARAVHEGDFFEFEYGLDEKLRHVPSQEAQGAITHVYCVAKFKDGGHYIDVMTASEIEAVKARSKAKNSGPWVTDYEAMARKTVVRRAFPYLPVSVEAQSAATVDETTPALSFETPIVEPIEVVNYETGEMLTGEANEGENGTE